MVSAHSKNPEAKVQTYCMSSQLFQALGLQAYPLGLLGDTALYMGVYYRCSVVEISLRGEKCSSSDRSACNASYLFVYRHGPTVLRQCNPLLHRMKRLR